ncbi:HET-domain-containing protein [Apiospora saccharicola]
MAPRLWSQNQRRMPHAMPGMQDVAYVSGGFETPRAELLLLNEDGVRPGFALGRRLDPGFIDIKLLNDWKRTCTEHHGHTCVNRLTSLSHPLLYLIDTQQMCLVPAAPEMTYVALSYVWGQVRMLKTAKDQLPRTIRDSIGLVPLLEERYLWVDSLCIPQDDEEMKHINISQMAAIYEGASLTIVACDGKDAEFGLRGLRRSSQSRSLPGVLPLAPGISITTRIVVNLLATPWSRRGWTLQEQIFSRRIILFYENTVQWLCRSTRYYEDIDSPHELPAAALAVHGSKSGQLNPLDLSLDIPELHILSRLIYNYLERDFTYQEDVMPALSSTFSAMQRAFPRGFIHGLPVSFFDASLLYEKPPVSAWNSYSEAFQVIPMLVWHTKESRDSEEKPIPFQNEWYDHKARFMGKSKDLPDGWVYCRGEETKDESSSRFKDYPECQARLWAGKPHKNEQRKGGPTLGDGSFVVRMFGCELWARAVLRDPAGAVVGELCADSMVQAKHINGVYPSAVPVEVVVISRGWHITEPQPVEKEFWEFYNVLWVEWEDGIAYRKGIGRVERSAWERLEKEDISLVLG